MARSTLPPAPHDGSTGNLIQRAEPKVKAASIAALLTPLALYYLYRYVPGIAGLPHELDAVLATVITGFSTFAAGYLARAVDRVDLFTKPWAEKADAVVTRAGDDAIGAAAMAKLETKARQIAADVALPVKTAVVDAVHAVEQAATADQDPLAAAKAQAPAVVDAVDQAVADGRAEATAVLAPVIEKAAPQMAVDVAAAAAAPPTSAAELEALLRHMIAQLSVDATPIADAAQTAAATPVAAPPSAAPAPAAPSLAPAGPATAPMAAVVAGTPAAG